MIGDGSYVSPMFEADKVGSQAYQVNKINL
jgi:hypothetical protein